MAKEVKTVKVTTAQEAQTIRAYQSFGWVLLNNQEIYVKDSHLEKNVIDNKIYSVTETTHYVKLTFERDPSKLKNYRQICKLENEYHSVPAPSKKPFLLPKWAVVCIGLFAAFLLLNCMITNEIMTGIILAAIFVLPTALWQQVNRSKMPAWEADCRTYLAKREQIVDQADQLCNE